MSFLFFLMVLPNMSLSYDIEYPIELEGDDPLSIAAWTSAIKLRTEILSDVLRAIVGHFLSSESSLLIQTVVSDSQIEAK